MPRLLNNKTTRQVNIPQRVSLHKIEVEIHICFISKTPVSEVQA